MNTWPPAGSAVLGGGDRALGTTDTLNSAASPAVVLLTPSQHPFLSDHHLSRLQGWCFGSGEDRWGSQVLCEVGTEGVLHAPLDLCRDPLEPTEVRIAHTCFVVKE